MARAARSPSWRGLLTIEAAATAAAEPCSGCLLTDHDLVAVRIQHASHPFAPWLGHGLFHDFRAGRTQPLDRCIAIAGVDPQRQPLAPRTGSDRRVEADPEMATPQGEPDVAGITLGRKLVDDRCPEQPDIELQTAGQVCCGHDRERFGEHGHHLPW